MEKYYTPNIEEFRVGFEYEVFQKGQPYDPNFMYFMEYSEKDEWFKFKYPDPFLGYDLKRIFKTYKNIRVKYLDKEDIESLGFTDIGALWFKNDDIQIRKWKGQELDIYDTRHQVQGEDISEYKIFRGIIKNKSELKVLLKQLNIIDEEK